MNAIKFIQQNGVDAARMVIGCAEMGDVETPNIDDLKRLVESVDIINKFDSVQEAKDAIRNAPDGATDYRKLSCTIRYIKQSERFFEYWDGFIWCRPAVPFTEETHILRFTELGRLKQAIADYELIYGGEHV